VEAAIVTEPGVDVGALVLSRLNDAYRLARAILLDDGDAEDAVQEASLVAWRRQSTLRDPDRFEPWFERILVNQCRDQLRRRKRAVHLAPPSVALDSVGGHAAGPGERGAGPDIDRALAALDLDHRIVVVMRYWQVRPVEDIAARLEIPAGTVKSRLHNALKSLRGSLDASRAEEARNG
jgi:DNA-directed RNA polymerase specialized sigma24 family protein